MRRAIDLVVSTMLPPRCAGCSTVVRHDHEFCVACWMQLRFLGPPWCAACHAPFAFDRGDGARCDDCVAATPRHAGICAAVAYGPVARTVALKLKYGRRTGLAVTVARQMRRLLPQDADLLLPVPLHRTRLWSRGYNQAALIATALSRDSGVACDVALLRRRRATPVLRGRDPAERRRAVDGAFAVDAPDAVAGRRVVLIDDVHTTGATANACVATLAAAGATSVTILCWARVLDPAASD